MALKSKSKSTFFFYSEFRGGTLGTLGTKLYTIYESIPVAVPIFYLWAVQIGTNRYKTPFSAKKHRKQPENWKNKKIFGSSYMYQQKINVKLTRNFGSSYMYQ